MNLYNKLENIVRKYVAKPLVVGGLVATLTLTGLVKEVKAKTYYVSPEQNVKTIQNGDVNGDSKIDINDVHYLLNYLFNEGPAPVPIVDGLPVTGQTKCYGNGNEIPCPNPGEPFYGQDGNYQAGIPRNFEVVKPNPHDDSTWYTTDHVTGLMWQYKNTGPLNWQDSLAYCENLTLGGFSDWRLPNVRELESVVDYGRIPAINTEVFFYESGQDRYWSSTSSAVFLWGNWSVKFNVGGMFMGDKTQEQFCVRAVRTIQGPKHNGDVNGDMEIDENDVHYLLEHLFNKGPAPVPIVTGLPVTGQTKCYGNENEIPCPNPGEPFYGQDGNYQAGIPRNFEVVKPNPHDESTWYTIDYVTGLMWQYAGDGIVRNWQDSLTYCENLELGGFNDWRLPNVRELESLINYDYFGPAITPGSLDGALYRHWTATTVTPWLYHGFYVNFDKGGAWRDQKEDNYYPSRAVRTIQTGDFPQREKTLEADLNNDGIVNLEDLAILGEQWLMTEDWYDGE